jgi:hypothetical protein
MRNDIYHDHCSDRIFRFLGLPFEVEASRVTAALDDGILELAIPKTTQPTPVWIVTQDRLDRSGRRLSRLERIVRTR